MNTPSPIPYEKIMEAISDLQGLQGDRMAIVILQNHDNTTTYLRHNISKEDMVELLINLINLINANPQDNGTTD